MDYIIGDDVIAEDAMTPDDIIAGFNKSNNDKTLEQHDKQFHPKGYNEGDTCKYRDRVIGEAEKEDDLSLKRNGKPNKFELPQLPEDVDIGTDPFDEIEDYDADVPLQETEEEIHALEDYAEEYDKNPEYNFWDEDDDDYDEDEDLKESIDEPDFYSWLQSLNPSTYKTPHILGMNSYPKAGVWKDRKFRQSDKPIGPFSYKDGTTLINEDITKFNGDVIVNAANKYMLGGGGVDGAIHRAAGPELYDECFKVAPYDAKNGYRCDTGDAKITLAGKLPCKYVIHTVGPDMRQKLGGEDESLRSAYRRSLELVKLNKCHSVAFPSISTGVYSFPLERAADIAAEEIHKFELENPDIKVTMCLMPDSMEAYDKAFAKVNGTEPQMKNSSSRNESFHGMFEGMTAMSPEEYDKRAVSRVCKNVGIEYPNKGTILSGRFGGKNSKRLEYTVYDKDLGMFASGRGDDDGGAISRSEEAMSFSDADDAKAFARAMSRYSKRNYEVLDKEGYKKASENESDWNKEGPKFPQKIDNSTLNNFLPTINGSTKPLIGKIGDDRFIAKLGSHTNNEHVQNEAEANNFLVRAGLNAPRSKTYKMPNGETVMLAEFIPNGESLSQAWDEASPERRKKIKDQIINAYPIASFMANIDGFQNDNTLVDKYGRVWFVDNGAAFDYRARGEKKGWYNQRTKPLDATNGYLSLVKHPGQVTLRKVIGDVPDAELFGAAKKYDFEKLVNTLPKEYRTQGLVEYAKALNNRAKLK